MNSIASVYIGEWANGLKSGYGNFSKDFNTYLFDILKFYKTCFLGVLDDIIAGEKYMGMWNNNEKSGQGCVVNFNGIYCEGIFRYVFHI